jgi:hypothetical protein
MKTKLRLIRRLLEIIADDSICPIRKAEKELDIKNILFLLQEIK